MPLIRLVMNILWFIAGGWAAGLLWLLGGVLLAITIVGLPYTGACFRIAGFVFWPYGKEIVTRDGADLGTGPVGCVLNVLWFVLGGWYIALAHLLLAVAEFISIIGIPFALKDLQLAQIALAPIGKAVAPVR